MATGADRADELAVLRRVAAGCVRCPELVATRTQVVFGEGDPEADVLFIGEAPGADEDREGVPFIGRSGQLLTRLLEEIGLRREDVFIANVLKCRPPDNRNPNVTEIANCRGHLEGQLAIIRPRVVCTLGNFATRLIRGKPDKITAVRGKPEVIEIGPHRARLLPMLHPAAALYGPANIELLRADIALLPGLLALDAPAALTHAAPASAPAPAAAEPPAEEARDAPDGRPQLGLF